MEIKKIRWNECTGILGEFLSKEEIKDCLALFVKYLKLRNYNYYIENSADIHIITKKYEYKITERATRKFIIVKEELSSYNPKRELDYVELIKI